MEAPDELCDWLEEFGGPVPSFKSSSEAGDNERISDNEHAFMPMIPYEVRGGSDGWASAAASSLTHNGFCVLRAPKMVAKSTYSACLNSAATRLASCFRLIREIGMNPRRDLLRYAELCSRTPGGMRYDMRFERRCRVNHRRVNGGKVEKSVDSADESVASSPNEDSSSMDHTHDSMMTSSAAAQSIESTPSCWADLSASVAEWVVPVLIAAGAQNPHVDSVGCVTSLPGAPDQHFHPDGTARGGPLLPQPTPSYHTLPHPLPPHRSHECFLSPRPRHSRERSDRAAAGFACVDRKGAGE